MGNLMIKGAGLGDSLCKSITGKVSTVQSSVQGGSASRSNPLPFCIPF